MQREDGGAILTEDSTLVRTTYEENQNYLVIPDAVISVVNILMGVWIRKHLIMMRRQHES